VKKPKILNFLGGGCEYENEKDYPWSNWGPCSKDCGGGKQKRTKTVPPIDDSMYTIGWGPRCKDFVLDDVQACNTHPCDCKVGDWMDWEPCSKYCGSGIQKATKSIISQPDRGGKACPPPAEITKTKTCNLRACSSVPEITYNIDGYDKWAGEAENEYVCPGVGSNTAKGRCTFYVEDDVKKYCNADPSCVGYVYKNRVYHPTRKVVNGNGIFIKKK
jgi:hypothetical protein